MGLHRCFSDDTSTPCSSHRNKIRTTCPKFQREVRESSAVKDPFKSQDTGGILGQQRGTADVPFSDFPRHGTMRGEAGIPSKAWWHLGTGRGGDPKRFTWQHLPEKGAHAARGYITK